MFRQATILALTTLSLSCFCGCSEPQAKRSTKTNWPYKFVRSKAEGDNKNVMRLFFYSGKFNQARLVEFCREQKRLSKAEAFLYVVIFDDAKNAGFPKYPFTAGFGDDEQRMRHVRAIYEHNRLNGFSELIIYDTNMWEGRPTTIKL